MLLTLNMEYTFHGIAEEAEKRNCKVESSGRDNVVGLCFLTVVDINDLAQASFVLCSKETGLVFKMIWKRQDLEQIYQ